MVVVDCAAERASPSRHAEAMVIGPQRTRTKHHVGRVRVRLAALLAARGYTVAPEDLHPQSGAWRTDCRLDVCRWEATVTDASGVTWMVQCWDTMSACVRYGITTDPDRRSPGYLDVIANRPESQSSGDAASSPTSAAAQGRGIRGSTTGGENR